MKRNVLCFLLCTAALVIVGCSQPKGLSDVYQDSFLIGAALNSDHVLGNDLEGMAIVDKHFNSLVAENMFKWEAIHPKPDTFVFDEQDQFAALGQQKDMHLVGHVLVWHSQTPMWVFLNGEGKLADRELLLERMRNHIHTVVGRYKGEIDGWDVVNEALEDDGSMRNSLWYRIVGEDYVEKAFEFAHEADPDAELYYNDYNMWKPGKAEGVVKLVNNLRNKGIRIDGVGVQGHWGLDYPVMEDLLANLQTYRELDTKVMITELDLNMLPVAWDRMGADVSMNFELKTELDPYSEGVTDSMATVITERFETFFKIFLEYDDIITRVTFWGVNDTHSWLNNWPVRGRTAYPLLFDRNYEPKPALQRLIDLKEKE